MAPTLFSSFYLPPRRPWFEWEQEFRKLGSRGKYFRTKIGDFLGSFHLLLWGKWEEVGQLGPSRKAA